MGEVNSASNVPNTTTSHTMHSMSPCLLFSPHFHFMCTIQASTLGITSIISTIVHARNLLVVQVNVV